ncbi:MAG: tol-pal system YbgF family protein [Polyangiales bacterium]
MTRCSFLALCLLSLPLSAQAQPAEAASPETEQADTDGDARAAFAAGSDAFEAGAYDGALRLFERSYELSGQPELLYNIGHCHDRLRNDQQAVASFEAYLEARPDAATRTAVEQRLSILRERVAQRAQQAEQLEAAERRAMNAERERLSFESRSAEEERPIVRQWWLWTIVGVIVVGATIGIVAATRDPGVESPMPGDGGVVYEALVMP